MKLKKKNHMSGLGYHTFDGLWVDFVFFFTLSKKGRIILWSSLDFQRREGQINTVYEK